MLSRELPLFVLHLTAVYVTSSQHQIKAIPKTCLDHLKDGAKENGHYSVAGPNYETTTVYCDFTSEPGSAWTLVTSWALANKNLPAFRSDPLTENVPVNERTPNWVSYRMSKKQMANVKTRSSHWRATCSFDKFGVDYTDYMRGSFGDFDITTYLGSGQCKKVEYINVRGNIGYQSTTAFWQVKKGYMLHTDSSLKPCEFNGQPGAKASEDNFGYYYTTNPAFRCTAGLAATTQYWFGEYL